METLNETDIERAKKHKSWMYRALIKHVEACETCRTAGQQKFTTAACEVGASLIDEYLISRNYADQGEKL